MQMFSQLTVKTAGIDSLLSFWSIQRDTQYTKTDQNTKCEVQRTMVSMRVIEKNSNPVEMIPESGGRPPICFYIILWLS